MIKIKFLLSVACCCIVLGVAAQTRKAVFIILDGIPADVIEKTDMPVLHEIAARGGYTRSYLGGQKDGFSQSPTISAVGYNHVLTGVWSHKHNVWDNDIKAPNYAYWNIFRIAEQANPSLQTAVFSSWVDNRTKLVGEGLPAAGSTKLDYSYDGLELDKTKFPAGEKRMFNIDESVSTEAGRYILEKGPDLSWVYLEYPDDMGHMYGDSPQFYDAIKKADAQVGRVWNAIKAREQQYNEQWMIVITTDHGRDAQTGKNHGSQTDRERTTWIYTNLHDLNARFKTNTATVDIMPSILRFLTIPLPTTTGQELDGVPFIGQVSVHDLKATRNGATIELSWGILDPTGKAEILVSTTNNVRDGKGDDSYTRVGEVAVSAGKYTFSQPETEFIKIVLKAPNNTINTWIVDNKYVKNARPMGRKY
jgi:hypothetical protein